MRCGFQTVIWGRRIDDFDLALDQIAACGYAGVEIAQAHQDIWIRDPHTHSRRRIDSILELCACLRARNLQLIGLAGGSLAQRVKFCESFRPEYLYDDKWDEDTKAVLQLNVPFTIGLHPHLFMPVSRLEQIREILTKNTCTHLKFIPDTAHLTIAEDDPVEAVRLFPDRLAAVHLKDWNSNFGRYSHRYAHGFTGLGLGQGVVPLKEVVAALKEMHYEGWIIAEQDSADVSPGDSALLCAEWMAGEGLQIRPDSTRLRALSARTAAGTIKASGLDRSVLEKGFLELSLLRALLLAQGKGARAFYQSVTDMLFRLMPCSAVHLWLFSPAHKRLELVAATGLIEHITHRILDEKDLVCQVADAEEIQIVNLADPEKAATFGNKQLLAHLPVKRMTSVPIFNSSNPHHLRFLLNLFPLELLPRDWRFPDPDELARLGEHISRSADSLMDELCSAAAGCTSYVCGRSRGKAEFLERLVRLIQGTFNCEGVAVFLVNQSRDKLELAASTGTEWNPRIPLHKRYYLRGKGLTGRAWQRREMLFAPHAPSEEHWQGLSKEKQTADRDECLFAPVAKPRGDVLAIIRCTNRLLPADSTGTAMFTDDDAAVLEAIIQAALPHLELLLSQDREIKALSRLTHEFQMPLVAIRGAVQLMQTALRVQGQQAESLFGEDYLEDVMGWTHLVGRLVSNADLHRGSFEGVPLVPIPTLLMKQVVAPAINQVKLFLKERDFTSESIFHEQVEGKILGTDQVLEFPGAQFGRIYYGSFRDVPELWIDRYKFQQVIFNLLSNSIKYATSKETFKVTILGGQIDKHYVIWFSDYGPGIDPGLEEIIFYPGFRGPGASEKYVAGQGLGLAVARTVVEAHGGRIQLTRNKNPTVFTVYLPTSLHHTPPTPIIQRRQSV